jgi:hypothetical protein
MSLHSAAEYPEGRRCACCSRLFEDGDVVIDRPAGSCAIADFFVPTCEECDDAGAPLEDGHPLADGRMPLLRADGTVG